jgi:hypothetical protein
MAAARRILVFEWLSADGSFASADGNLNWVVPDDEQAQAAATGMPAADTVLFGRRTYELFEGIWRKGLQDSAAAPDPHRPGQRSKEHRAIAGWMNEATKLEQGSPRPRARSGRARSAEATTRQEHDGLRQRIHRVAADSRD